MQHAIMQSKMRATLAAGAAAHRIERTNTDRFPYPHVDVGRARCNDLGQRIYIRLKIDALGAIQ